MYAHQQKCLRKARCPEHTSPSWSSWSSSHILADPLSLQCPFDQCLPRVSEGYELWLFSLPDVYDVQDFMLFFHMHVYFDPMFIYFLYFHRIVYLKNCYPGYPGQSGIAQVLLCCCLISWMPNQKEIKQEVIDEDDGLGDEPPKAELTEEEARCSMFKGCGARGIGEQKVWSDFVSDTTKGIYYWIERMEMMLRFSLLQFTDFLGWKSTNKKKTPWFFFAPFDKIPKDKKKVFRTKTVDFGSTTLSKHLHQFSLPVPWQFPPEVLLALCWNISTPNAPIVCCWIYCLPHVSCKFSEY